MDPRQRSRRRSAASLAAAAVVALGAGCVADPEVEAPAPVTGPSAPGLEAYDSIVPRMMAEHRIPGGAVAVAKDGRLVLARGYGWADVEAGTPAEPGSLFRIASVSKPVTAAAIMTLVERGRLRPDDRAFELLADLEPPVGSTPDPGLADVTVEQLLRHSGGWDRNRSFDPMFRPGIAAAAVGAPAPADAETVIRYMLGQPLDFDPGVRVAYSNFGYAVLGRVIERVTGTSYETFVRDEVLAPAGITGMRTARTRVAERAPGEVRYYDPGQAFGEPRVPSVFPGEGEVPLHYGGFYIEAMDAHGGWLASAVDLVRFALATDGRSSVPDVLGPASVERMIERSDYWTGSDFYIGYGWFVRPSRGDANWWHGGALPGTTTLLVRAYTDVVWAAVFNSNTHDGTFAGDLDRGMWRALESVVSWPSHDLFDHFGGAVTTR